MRGAAVSRVHRARIAEVRVTSVAVPLDGRLLHSDGAEPACQVRHILELVTDTGLTGLGELGPRVTREQLGWAARQLRGCDPFDLEGIRLMLWSEKFYRIDLASLAAGVQIACLDLQAKQADVSVADLLGGRRRESVPVIAYLMRKRSSDYGAAVITNADLVDHAQTLVPRLGCGTLKLKAGAVPLEEDLQAARLLREAFPEHRLRVDANGSWTLASALYAAQVLQPLHLEWLEDPALGTEGMAAVARRTTIPLATNMCCIQPRDLPYTVREDAVDAVLLDIWYLGGPWFAKQMASMCRAFGLALGVHSGGGSCELGIGLAAQLHFAASLPGLVHAADSQYHHLKDDIIQGGPFVYHHGMLQVPAGPGLGVELDRERMGRYAELFEQERRSPSPSSFPAYPRW